MMTNLMRWSPFDELWTLGDQLARELNRWSGQIPGTGLAPTASLVSDEDGWRLRVALPGVSPENVEMDVAGRTVHIRVVEREADNVRTRYEQMVTVPDAVDVEKIVATFRHGLLEVKLPMKEAIKPRRIEISTEAPKELSNAA